jgi:hypothetical protein
METRERYGTTADECFDSFGDTLARLARALRALIRQAIATAAETIKRGMPVY